jgi:hypothetical protein
MNVNCPWRFYSKRVFFFLELTYDMLKNPHLADEADEEEGP